MTDHGLHHEQRNPVLSHECDKGVAKVMKSESLVLLLKFLVGAGLLFIIFISVADSVWSIPNAYPKVITSYYSNAYRAKHAFRCANTVLRVGGETFMNIDCIETRDGWRFDYEGVPDDASEGMSVLQKSM